MEYIANGNPAPFPKPNDGWEYEDKNWYTNEHPAPNLKPSII